VLNLVIDSLLSK